MCLQRKRESGENKWNKQKGELKVIVKGRVKNKVEKYEEMQYEYEYK